MRRPAVYDNSRRFPVRRLPLGRHRLCLDVHGPERLCERTSCDVSSASPATLTPTPSWPDRHQVLLFVFTRNSLVLRHERRAVEVQVATTRYVVTEEVEDYAAEDPNHKTVRGYPLGELRQASGVDSFGDRSNHRLSVHLAFAASDDDLKDSDGASVAAHSLCVDVGSASICAALTPLPFHQELLTVDNQSAALRQAASPVVVPPRPLPSQHHLGLMCTLTLSASRSRLPTLPL
jgi:hypothetical protein